jgi:hypothetical protein
LKIRLVSSANLELDEAVRYYDHQLPGLGFRFFQETSAAIERIGLMPEAWKKVGQRTRRCMLKGFPLCSSLRDRKRGNFNHRGGASSQRTGTLQR